jgi:aconitate hydratase
MQYRAEQTPLIVIAGSEYGTGSSRDWAAKGTYLFGVKAVIARSFERIHRSNLVGTGVLPLQFMEGESAESLGLTGGEVYQILGLNDSIKPKSRLTVVAENELGKKIEFQVIVRLDTHMDIDYYRNGGILQAVIRRLL